MTTENKSLQQKHGKITIYCLLAINAITLFMLIDKFVIPKQEIFDSIYQTRSIFVKKSEVAKIFETYYGYQFATEKKLIDKNEIIIKYSPITQLIYEVTEVESGNVAKLNSGFTGVTFYFSIIFLIGSVISIWMLKYRENVSNNAFQNIILFHCFIIIIAAFMYEMYNPL